MSASLWLSVSAGAISFICAATLRLAVQALLALRRALADSQEPQSVSLWLMHRHLPLWPGNAVPRISGFAHAPRQGLRLSACDLLLPCQAKAIPQPLTAKQQFLMPIQHLVLCAAGGYGAGGAGGE